MYPLAYPKVVALVAEVADKRGGEGISNLAHEEKSAGLRIGKVQHKMHEDQQIGEPHGGAHVV